MTLHAVRTGRLMVVRAAAMFVGVGSAIARQRIAVGWTVGCDPAQAGPVMPQIASRMVGHRKGRIAPGFDADILAITGNPLDDLTAIRRLRAVYAGGRAVLPAPGNPAEVEVP